MVALSIGVTLAGSTAAAGPMFSDGVQDGTGTPVAITSANAVAGRAWQRGAPIALSGTFSLTARPSGFAARVGAADWIALAGETIAAAAAGSWSGTLTFPSDYAVQGTLQLKPRNGINVTPASRANITISDVFVVDGDSMASGIGDAALTYTQTNFACVVWSGSAWTRPTVDSWAGLGSGGAPWLRLAERIDQSGIPPVLVRGNTASGSAFHPGLGGDPGGSWSRTPDAGDSAFYYTTAVSNLTAARLNGAKAIIDNRGPNDVIDGVSTAQYAADLSGIIDGLQADVPALAGVPMLVPIIGEVIPNDGIPRTTTLDAVRAAQLAAIAADADILRGPSYMGFDLGDGVHVGKAPAGAVQQRLEGDMWWRAVARHFYAGSAAETGPGIVAAAVTGARTVRVGFDRAVANHADIRGWRIEDGGGAKTVASAAQGADATEVVVTVASDLATASGSVLVTFGQGGEANGATLADTLVPAFPPEYAIDVPAGEAFPVNSVRPALSGIPAIGTPLATTDGTWISASTLAFAYQWLTAESGGSPIAGATAASYTPVAGDAATLATMVCRVTATNARGATAALSTTGDPGLAATFGGGIVGGWYRPELTATLRQDSAGATPVAADNDRVGQIVDQSGGAHHLLQATAGSRLTYDNGDTYPNVFGDGTDDDLRTTAFVADGDILMAVAANYAAVGGTPLGLTGATTATEQITIEDNRVGARAQSTQATTYTSFTKPTGRAVVVVLATESNRTVRVWINGTEVGSVVLPGTPWFDTANTQKIVALASRGSATFQDYTAGAIYAAYVAIGPGVSAHRAAVQSALGARIGLSL